MIIWNLDTVIKAEFVAFMAQHWLTKPWRLWFLWQCFFQPIVDDSPPDPFLIPANESIITDLLRLLSGWC